MGFVRLGGCLIIFCTLTTDLRAGFSESPTQPFTMTRSALQTADTASVASTPVLTSWTLDGPSMIKSTFGFSPDVPMLYDQPFNGETLTIKAPPSSLHLVLSGMLAVGAWHGVRAGRQITMGGLPIPDWYHDGGPAQIGHATPFDLDFGSLPLCCFEQPVGQRAFLYRVLRDSHPRPGDQCTFIIAAPRGPPFCAA